MALPFATCSNAKLSKRDFALSQPQKQQRQTNTNTATKQTKKIKAWNDLFSMKYKLH